MVAAVVVLIGVNDWQQITNRNNVNMMDVRTVQMPLVNLGGAAKM